MSDQVKKGFINGLPVMANFVGNLGGDAKVQYFNQDRKGCDIEDAHSAVITFSVARNRTYSDKNGQQYKATAWHLIRVMGPVGEGKTYPNSMSMAEVAADLKKGDTVRIVNPVLEDVRWTKTDQDTGETENHQAYFLTIGSKMPGVSSSLVLISKKADRADQGFSANDTQGDLPFDDQDISF